MIDATCPACSTWLSIPQALAGQTAKCPKCGQEVTAPQPEQIQAICLPGNGALSLVIFLIFLNVMAGVFAVMYIMDSPLKGSLLLGGLILSLVMLVSMVAVIRLLQKIAGCRVRSVQELSRLGTETSKTECRVE